MVLSRNGGDEMAEMVIGFVRRVVPAADTGSADPFVLRIARIRSRRGFGPRLGPNDISPTSTSQG